MLPSKVVASLASVPYLLTLIFKSWKTHPEIFLKILKVPVLTDYQPFLIYLRPFQQCNIDAFSKCCHNIIRDLKLKQSFRPHKCHLKLQKMPGEVLHTLKSFISISNSELFFGSKKSSCCTKNPIIDTTFCLITTFQS